MLESVDTAAGVERLTSRAVVVDHDCDRARRLEAVLSADGFVVEDEVDKADVLVLGFNALGREQREMIARAREQAVDTPLVVVVGHAAPRTARDALAAGADALVLDSRARSALAAAVNATLTDQLALPRDFRDGFRRPALSRREKQVLGLVVMGFLNVEIAAKLHLAESTVKSHLSSCFTKLGVRTRSEATALILDPDSGLGLGVLGICGNGDADDA
jgi:DNA-binding NarL/FixJ family response regulator